MLPVKLHPKAIDEDQQSEEATQFTFNHGHDVKMRIFVVLHPEQLFGVLRRMSSHEVDHAHLPPEREYCIDFRTQATERC